MSRPVCIIPEYPLTAWFDPGCGRSTEEQIIRAIVQGIGEEDREGYFNASLSDIPNPASLKHIDQAVDLLIYAFSKNKKILIVGDYDVDGITSTALLIRFFRKIGFSSYDYFIPNRFTHGYGLTEKTVEIIKKRRPDLVITVDNGITARQEIDQIKSYGIEVIVTDHHLPQENSLPECAVLNPNQNDCNYPFKYLSGVGVVFLLLIAVRSKLRDRGFWTGKMQEPNLLEHLDLVALGTIADQVPLLGLNRILAKFGLNQMTKRLHEGYPNGSYYYLKAFAEKAHIRSFNSEVIAFNLAPLLNATGRMKDAEEGLVFIMSEDDQTAMSRYHYLDRLNQKRRKKQQIMSQKAVKIAETLLRKNQGIVVYNESFHEGLIGIIASHLLERFYLPSIVLSDGENGTLKASCRSRNENIMDLLKSCDDILIQFGGHANAAGFSLEKHRLQDFHERFTDACLKAIPQDKKVEVKANLEVTQEMMTYALLEKLRILEPYGHLNRKPVFYLSGVALPVPTTMTGKHLKWKLESDLDLIYWNGADSLPHASRYDVAFTFGENVFRGKRTRQMIVNSIVAVDH